MQLAVFKYKEEEASNSNDFTAIEIDGEPWFIASEVCQLLDIQNSRQAIQSLDDDEKLMYTLHTSGQGRNVNLINESGLYNLVFRSKKESAKKFRKWITKEVIPSIRKTGSFGINRIETPNFIVRFNDNWDKVDRGHFSVISELFVRLYGRFEHVGYRIPNKALNGVQIRPDNSVGKLFSTFLKEHHPDKADNYKKYKHHFPDGLVVDARQYPNEMLPIFIRYVDEYWIPNCAERYFGERDKLALDYLPKLLGA